jgi:hypothetical protein
MKKILIPVLAMAIISSCKKTIDLYPQFNLNTGTFKTEEIPVPTTNTDFGRTTRIYHEGEIAAANSTARNRYQYPIGYTAKPRILMVKDIERCPFFYGH